MQVKLRKLCEKRLLVQRKIKTINQVFFLIILVICVFFNFYTSMAKGDEIIELIPDACSCEYFYVCEFGIGTMAQCPSGLFFNPTLNSCDFPEESGCSHNYWEDELDQLPCGQAYVCSSGDPGGGTPTTCSCKSGTPSSSNTNIPGGVLKKITTEYHCNQIGGCTCQSCPAPSISYTCTCNSGYTVANQGTSSCNCIRCSAGYYVAGSLSEPYCEQCPLYPDPSSPDGISIRGTTVANNTSTSPTSCYIPTSSTFSDSSGTYEITSTCSYSD